MSPSNKEELELLIYAYKISGLNLSREAQMTRRENILLTNIPFSRFKHATLSNHPNHPTIYREDPPPVGVWVSKIGSCFKLPLGKGVPGSGFFFSWAILGCMSRPRKDEVRLSLFSPSCQHPQEENLSTRTRSEAQHVTSGPPIQQKAVWCG